MVNRISSNRFLWHFVAVVFLVVYIFLVYGPNLRGALFVGDDVLIIPYIQKHGPFSGFYYPGTDVPWFSSSYYRPLIVMQAWINYRLFGLNYAGYQASVLLQHFLVSVIFYYALYLITRSISLSLVIALVFAAHPYVSNIVIWVSDANSILGICAGLIIVWLVKQKYKTGWYFLLLILLLLASLARENGLALIATVSGFSLFALITKRFTKRQTLFVMITAILSIITYFFLRRLAGIMLPGEFRVQQIEVIFANVVGTFFPIFRNGEGDPHALFVPGYVAGIALLSFFFILILVTSLGRHKWATIGNLRRLITIIAIILSITICVIATVTLVNNLWLASSKTRYILDTIVFAVHGSLSIIIGYALLFQSNWSSKYKLIAILALGLIATSALVAFSYFRHRLLYVSLMGWLLLLAISLQNLPPSNWRQRVRSIAMLLLILVIAVQGISLNRKLPWQNPGQFPTILCDERVTTALALEIAELYDVESDAVLDCRGENAIVVAENCDVIANCDQGGAYSFHRRHGDVSVNAWERMARSGS